MPSILEVKAGKLKLSVVFGVTVIVNSRPALPQIFFFLFFFKTRVSSVTKMQIFPQSCLQYLKSSVNNFHFTFINKNIVCNIYLCRDLKVKSCVFPSHFLPYILR